MLKKNVRKSIRKSKSVIHQFFNLYKKHFFNRKYEFFFRNNDLQGIDTNRVFENAYVVGGTRFIMAKSGLLTFFKASSKQIKYLFKRKAFLQEERDNEFVSQDYNNQQIKIQLKVSTISIKGNTISCLHPASYNFYHFCVEALYDLILALYHKIKIDNVLVDCNIPRKYRMLIKLLSPGSKIITVKNAETINIEKLYAYALPNIQCLWFRNSTTKPLNFINPKWFNIANGTFSRLFSAGSGVKKNLISIIKRNAKHRITINENLIIEEVYKKYSDVIVLSPEKNLKKTVNTLNNTKVLLMQSGAAITNLLFLRKKIKIILWQNINHNNDLSILDFARSLGHEVKVVHAKPILRKAAWHPDLKSIYQADLICDIKGVIDYIT